jgi:hypothetical protein
MQKFRAWMAAALVAAGTGLLGWPATAEEGDKPPETAGLQTAAYDVIIVPRQGGGAPRVMTERGWRSLLPQTSRARIWSRQQPFHQRDVQGWGDRDVYRYARPAAPYPRWTTYEGYRSGYPRPRPYAAPY